METADPQIKQLPPPPPTQRQGAADAKRHHHVPTHFRPGIERTLSIIAGALAVVLLIGFIIVHHRRAKNAEALEEQASAASAAIVDVVRVKYSPDTSPLTMPGGTSGWYQSTIYARVSGYVATWTADIGDRVKKGEVLATIDTPELDARLAAAKARLAAANADVNVAQASVALAKSTYQRWWESPKGVVSEQERQEKKAEYDTSVAKLNAAEAQVQINQADVNSLLAFTAYKEVTAPFDGVITARKIDIGDLVTAGSTANTTFLYSIAQSDRLRVFVDVPQSASAGLRVGMPAVVRSSEFPGRNFDGRLARTSNSIDPASRTLHVEVDIENRDLALVPGMYVQVSFELIRKSLLEIPASALLFRAAGTQVAVVGDDGIVHFHNVTIVNDEGDVVEISADIPPTAKVALNLGNEIAQGQKVHAHEIDNPVGATQKS